MKKTLLSLVISLICIIVIIALSNLYVGYQSVPALGPVDKSVRVDIPVRKTITLNFVGDILAARSIELTMRKKGYDYPFQKIAADLGNADITFANLESPLIGTATSGKTTPGGTTVFRGDVDLALSLKKAGIDVVSLANNHMKDQGQKGIQSTIETLDTAGIKHAGAGLDLDQARRLTIIDVGSTTDPVKVGFLAYNDSDVVPPSYHATKDQSGTHIMNLPDLQEDVAAARMQVDVIIVSMHSGTEYITTHPNQRQIDFAHAAIDAGADIVIGHHPHVLQPMELYKGKYIYYSLGNFVFDQPWPDTKQSVLIHMQVDLEKKTSENLWSVRGYYPDVLPLQIVQFQPQKTTTIEQSKSVFDILKIPRSILKLGSNRILVEKATTDEARERGLSERFGLPEKTGMLFVFDIAERHGIWMKNMRFPIDIYWFNKDFKIVHNEMSVSPNTYPNVFYPPQDDLYVLETAEGQLDTQSLTKDLTGELTESNTYDKN